MANNKGSSGNPFYVVDSRPSTWFSTPAQIGTVSYLDIADDEDRPVEKSIHEIPTASRTANRRKRQRDHTPGLENQAIERQDPRFLASSSQHHPSDKRTTASIIDLTNSDDDEDEVPRRVAPQRSGSNDIFIEAKAVVPATNGLHLGVGNTRLIERTKQSTRIASPTSHIHTAASSTSRADAALSKSSEEPTRAVVADSSLSSRVIQIHERSPQGHHTAQADTTTQVSYSSSGNRPDSGREQTTSRRVGSNAISAPGRANDDIDPVRPQAVPRSSERSREKRTEVLRSTIKPRAIKSAANPPIRHLGSTRYSRRPARNHAQSSSSALAPPKVSIGNTSSREQKQDQRPFRTSDTEAHDQGCNVGQNSNRDNSSLVSLHGISHEDDTIMGAQISGPEASSVPKAPAPKAKETLPALPKSTHQSLLSPSQQARAETDQIAPISSVPTVDVSERVSSASIQFNVTKGIEIAHQEIEAALKHCLLRRYEDHAYLVKNTMWRQRTCYERETRSRFNSKRLQTFITARESHAQSTSPFVNMTDIQTPFEKNNSKDKLHAVTQEVFTKATPKDIVIKSSWNSQATTYVPKDLQVPSFIEYISLRSNILADNESKLLTVPWLGDDEPQERQFALVDELPTRYEIKHDINAQLDLRKEQCRFYFDSIASFLTGAGLTWDMMLYWLLSPDTSLRQINQALQKHDEFEGLVMNRTAYAEETFIRDGREITAVLFKQGPECWQKLLPQLREPSSTQLRVVALVGAALLSNCGFSPWYVAEQSKRMQDYVAAKTRVDEIIPESTYRSIVCRICHEHDCLFHGEIREYPDSDFPSDTGEESSADEESQEDEESMEDEIERLGAVGTYGPSQRSNDIHENGTQSVEDNYEPIHFNSDDSDVENLVNYKYAVNPDIFAKDKRPRSKVLKRKLPKEGPFKPEWWRKHSKTTWEKRKPFFPCSHDGSCTDAQCRCFRENITCEKTCRCHSDCYRRFPGCRCASLPGKRACSKAATCPCVKFDRECDADICGTCGATDILDPVNRYNEDISRDKCTNVGLQRGVPKKTLLGKSEVHGFGVYAGEDICREEVIGEYAGEVISTGEAGRRGTVYSYEKNMYLFRLNTEQEVDATHMGNKMRFINNANLNLSNCASKVLFCNTVFRIAIYAIRDIKAGQELFFFYNYPNDMTTHFKQPKGKVVAIKQIAKQHDKTKKKRVASRASPTRNLHPTGAGASVEKPDRPWVKAALAKARAAKAAKRAKMLAEKELQNSTTATSAPKILKQARKSAGGPSTLRTPQDVASRGRSLRENDSRARNQHTASTSTRASRSRNRRSALEVQETDDEDADDAQGGAENSDPQDPEVEESEQDPEDDEQASEAVSRTRNPVRARMLKSATVFAVKKGKKKMGGVRPGAGRKRKRPLVVNSEDE